MLRPFSASPYLPLRADNHYTLFHFSTENIPPLFSDVISMTCILGNSHPQRSDVILFDTVAGSV